MGAGVDDKMLDAHSGFGLQVDTAVYQVRYTAKRKCLAMLTDGGRNSQVENKLRG
jgi:hypothetical protein